MKYRKQWWVVGLALGLAGCGAFNGKDDAVSQLTKDDAGEPDSDQEADASQPASSSSHGNGEGGSSSHDAAGGDSNPTADAGTAGDDDGDLSCAETKSQAIVGSTDKVDLLFMVDNSGSMAQEQAALSEQFPGLINMLTTGDLDGDGEADVAAANSLHLGVVSSDMGLVGISDIMHCQGLGDDGLMQNTPRLPGCEASYPRFLSYTAGISDPEQTAQDFACIASLGTEGCGFEQQLEVTLKALWPEVDPAPKPDGTNRITFLGDVNGFGQFGHGDNDNMGFLRNDPEVGTSVVAVVVVTDEEDCSSLNTLHFRPSNYLDPAKPEDAELLKQGLNVRCNFNPQNLYPVQRYIKGLQALRPGNENRVVFGAIVGVPPETVSDQALAAVDFDDAASRDDFYSSIFDHEKMQPVVDPGPDANDPNDDTMTPSCETSSGRAYPPTRIVQVAQGFGANGMVQSICNQDFAPAMKNIAATILRAAASTSPARPLCER